MTNKLIIIIGLGLLIFQSCNTQESMDKKIHALENSPTFLDTSQQNQLLNLYLKYAHKYPDADQTVSYWFHGIQELYYRQKNQQVIKEGLQYLNQYDSSPFHRNLQIVLAKSYYKTNQLDSSVSFYEKAEQLNTLNTDELQDFALVFIKKEVENRGDSIGGYYLLRASKALSQSQQQIKALEILDDLLNRYRGIKQEPEAIYLKAKILEDEEKIEESEAAYNDLVLRFPNHPMSKDVSILLKKGLVGLSAEEIFEKIKND